MKWKILVVLLALSCSNLVYGQTDQPLISIEVADQPLKEVLTAIEKQTGYKFFYADSWLPTEPLQKSYTRVPLDTVLKDLLENTHLNFFMTADNRIIITRNTIIYDVLPEDYFPTLEDSTVVEEMTEYNRAPVLLEKQEPRQESPIETVRIGKEIKETGKKRFKLSGYARDAATGNPLPDLAVFLSDKSTGTVTDKAGYYELYIPSGIHLLETSAVGIEKVKKRVLIFSDGQLNFSLSATTEQLNEIVLQSQGNSNVADASTGNERIDAEDSKNIPLVLGERNVLKVATMLPGVTTTGEGASGFNVRGGKTDQNLILLDDAVIYNPSHFFGIFQALNPLAIDDLTIYKGNIPAEYGGRISSVFDIETKDANTQKVGAQLSVGPVTANAVAELPVVKEKSGVMVGARAAYSDWVLRSLNDSDLENSTASFYDMLLKYNHQINDTNNAKVLAYYSKDRFSITSDSLYKYSNRLFSAKWDHAFSDKSTGALILTNSQYKFSIDYDDELNDNFTQGFQVDETGLQVKLNTQLKNKHAMTYGLAGKIYTIKPGYLSPKGTDNLLNAVSIPQERAFESAFFVADTYEVTERLLLDYGLRYSWYAYLGPTDERVYAAGLPLSEATAIDTVSYGKNKVVKSYGGPEIRLSGRYLLAEDLSIKASYNSSYQFIHTLSNNTTVSPIDTWKLSDGYIKPQQAQQYSMGIYKNIGLNAYELSIEGFYKKQQHIVDFKTGASLLLNEHIETEALQGKGKSYGVELLVKKNQGNLNGWLGYTYSRSLFQLDSPFPEESVNGGNYFPSNFDKPHDLSMVLNYKFNQRISLSGNFVYQTGRPVTFPIGFYQFNDTEYVLYSDRNQYRVPDYYRLDIAINFEGNHKKKKLAHGFWSLSVYNVLGRNNPYSIFFINEDGKINAYQSSIFSVPIPSITYNIRF